MHMRVASVLLLKPQPVVGGSTDSDIESLEELHNTVVEEPVSKGWVLNDSLGTSCPEVKIVRADEAG